MSDDLSIQGSLDETTVPDLFRSLIRTAETAVLTFQGGERTDVIHFREGRIVFASSTDPDTGLAEMLLRSGELTLSQYQQAIERLVVSQRMGSLLLELGYLQADGLIRAVERRASVIVLDSVARRSGSYTIGFTEELPEGTVSLPLNTERLILDGIRAIEHWSLIWRGLVRMERTFIQVPNADSRGFQLELNEDESHVLELLSQPLTVAGLCERSYLSSFLTCRTAWALLSVNLLQDSDGEVTEEKRVAVENEYELEGTVERYNTIFQSIFTEVQQKIGDHIYDFVDRVVLHLSPETMPYLSGMSLVNEARIDFEQLLNNLIASGVQKYEPVVLDLLNELVYGWIIEVRTEFGPSMETEVVRLIASLKQ